MDGWDFRVLFRSIMTQPVQLSRRKRIAHAASRSISSRVRSWRSIGHASICSRTLKTRTSTSIGAALRTFRENFVSSAEISRELGAVQAKNQPICRSSPISPRGASSAAIGRSQRCEICSSPSASSRSIHHLARQDLAGAGWSRPETAGIGLPYLPVIRVNQPPIAGNGSGPNRYLESALRSLDEHLSGGEQRTPPIWLTYGLVNTWPRDRNQQMLLRQISSFSTSSKRFSRST